MKKKDLPFLLVAVVAALAVVWFGFSAAADSNATFEDENLEAAIRETLELEEGPIQKKSLQNVDAIDLSDREITSLEGINNLPTLRTLDLANNEIKDISPLEDLLYLEDLNLQTNNVMDLSPLADLIQIKELNLRENYITDLSPLTGMAAMVDLNLRDNQVVSLNPLTNMINLRVLNIRGNQVEDISVLSSLIELQDINLRNNKISDFSPVIELPNLTERLYATGNPELDEEQFVSFYNQVEEIDLDDPRFVLTLSKNGGLYEEELTVEINQLIATEGTIRYTTDGSEPDEASQEYTAPVTISETTALKAKFFDPYGRTGSAVTSTYIVGEPTDFTVVSISMNEEDLLGASRGIYAEGPNFDPNASRPRETANYGQSGEEWERLTNVEFFTADGTPIINQNAGIRIHGNATREYPKKSFRLYARSEYGLSTFNYPVFGEEHLDEYKRLILRTSGNDWSKTLFRDAFLQTAVEDLNIETQAFEPALLYVNGEYWGIYNIRERIDRHYFEEKFRIAEEDFELLEHNNTFSVEEGDSQHYQEMLDYMRENDMNNPETYAEISTRMDIDNFIDYTIAQVYTSNTDWPGNNNRFWRGKPDGKWRWTLYDMDYAFNNTGIDRTVSHHTLNQATDDSSRRWPNPEWSTFLLRTLMENETFRNEFSGKFAHYLNTHFEEERLTNIISDFEAMYEPEMQRNIDRWNQPASLETWHEEIQVLRDYSLVRDDYVYAHLLDYFNLAGYTDYQLNVKEGSNVEIFQQKIPLQDGKWSGRYLSGVPIELTVNGEVPDYQIEDENVVTMDKDRGLIGVAAGETSVTISKPGGEEIGQILITVTDVERTKITMQPGEVLNWEAEVGKGTYANVSNPQLGAINGNTFTAQSNGAVLLTVHNQNDEVISMSRITIERENGE